MEEFDERHIKALHMLIAGESHIATAQAVGVCDRTIRRWLSDPDFSSALHMESTAIFSCARVHSRVRFGLEAEKGLVATRFVSHVMETDELPISVRLRAAEQLRNSSAKWGFWAFKQDCDAAAAPTHKMASSGGQKPKVTRPFMEDTEPANADAEKNLIDSIITGIPSQIVPEMAKIADISGQKRTRQGSASSAAEHQARRERLEKLEKQYAEMGRAAQAAVSAQSVA